MAWRKSTPITAQQLCHITACAGAPSETLAGPAYSRLVWNQCTPFRLRTLNPAGALHSTMSPLCSHKIVSGFLKRCWVGFHFCQRGKRPQGASGCCFKWRLCFFLRAGSRPGFHLSGASPPTWRRSQLRQNHKHDDSSIPGALRSLKLHQCDL